MKNLKWAYYESTIANFFFSFDLNQDGIFDEREHQESFAFWSSKSNSERQHQILGEMCFASL